jgi:hypothetical protein
MIKYFYATNCSNLIPQLIYSNNHHNYSCIYLCIKKDIKNPYKFIKFYSLIDAQYYYEKNYSSKVLIHKYIPICDYTPDCFHKYILNYKLSKLSKLIK